MTNGKALCCIINYSGPLTRSLRACALRTESKRGLQRHIFYEA